MSVVAFVLVSWRPDAPAGMERAVAAHAAGLVAAGHHTVIVTAEKGVPPRYAGAAVETLSSLNLPSPCDDQALRAAIETAAEPLRREFAAILTRHRADAVVYVDALWGAGRIMPAVPGVRRVLGMHVVGHDIDLQAALPAADVVIAPSAVVLRQAAERGYGTVGWQVVPNALLVDEAAPSRGRRQWLAGHGPIRVLARLGAEKGVEELLEAATGARFDRPVELALNAAGFEPAAGDQDRLLQRCRQLADRTGATVIPGLPWAQVPGWLAGAAVVVVPSRRETFGLVALEAMSVGTPVAAFAVDNLPDLVGAAGVVVPVDDGPVGLWRAAGRLLGDPVSYGQISRAGYTRSRDYRPALVADLLLKVVS